jgi:opacity protein-like surface antigen
LKRRSVFLVIVAAILIQGAVQVASADQVNGAVNLQATGWNANGTLITSGGTSGTWMLTLDFVNGTSNTVDINSFAVQLFNAGSGESFSLTNHTVIGSSSSGSWEFFADDKLNNGGTPDCSSASVKGWLCGDTGQGTLHPYSIAAGHTAEFILSGDYTSTSAVNPLDLMASGCLVAGTCKLDGGASDGSKWTVSGAMLATPEPTSMLLVGGALSLMGILARRKQASK